MKGDKYSEMNEMTAFGFIANALDQRSRHGHGDTGASFPRSDAEDFSRGVKFVPGEVTLARRRGERVDFVQPCQLTTCWYWQFKDGSRTYHWQRYEYAQIAKANGIEPTTDQYGDAKYENGVGNCPYCGNAHTRGGHIEAKDL